MPEPGERPWLVGWRAVDTSVLQMIEAYTRLGAKRYEAAVEALRKASASDETK